MHQTVAKLSGHGYTNSTLHLTSSLPPSCRMGLPADRKLLRWMGEPPGIVLVKGKLVQPQSYHEPLSRHRGRAANLVAVRVPASQLGGAPGCAAAAVSVMLTVGPTAADPTSPHEARTTPGGSA